MNTLPTIDQLLAMRKRWLEAARIYYLSAGDDSGMTDYEWDRLAGTLFYHRHELPGCPVLHGPGYTGGSLFWVTDHLYRKALEADPLKHPPRKCLHCGHVKEE